MELISNINNSHFDKLNNIFSNSDRIVIVSPFLSESFEMSPLQDISTLKEIILYTTLKSNSIESIDKVLALNNFVEVCKKNDIKYTVRIDNNLHAKIYVAFKNGEPEKALISSANFTNKGLKVNHEVGIIINEEELIKGVIDEIEKLPFDELSEKALGEIFKKLDDYKNIKNATELPKIDLDFSPYFSKSKIAFNRENSETKYFIKPVGNQEYPFPVTSTLSNPIEKLYFSNRYPRAVTPGSIMICYAVGDGRAIGYYEVLSDVFIDVKNTRYPYYVEAKNLNIQYSKDWAKYSVYITQAANSYLGLSKTNTLIFNGNKTLGALNFGSDKIRLNSDFADYLIAEIEDSKNKSLPNISCPLNKYQILIAKELVAAAKCKDVRFYGDLYTISENYYNYETIGRALGEISNFCIQLNFPLLSSIAVSSETKLPSHGFNKAFNKEGIPEFEFSIREMKKVYEFKNWDNFLEYLK